ncbi:extracellular solute-binding protein family 1 [Oscillochloris trichoides DG-6]|uniref:Extracellular solute-binding protein family 1 n=1 Tax=Oscillochloris trichoides DG-6 TaxID=765420 RepID=E1IF40_9CHLR|nr:extracellular solute-binding protein [Oscillochloris trichoides]EFO80207.1 extracellular solute-binding protein family 1 [Oscillochloris trichoides DG-6]
MKTQPATTQIGWLGIVLLLFLAACAAPPNSPTPSPVVPTQAPSPTPSPLPSPTPVARSLRLWVGEDAAALPAIQAVITNFTQASGTPITVIPKPPDALRLSVAGLSLSGEAPPDLIWADQEILAGLLADGYLQPVRASGDALPGLQTAATSQSQLWGIPITAQNQLLLLYNRSRISSPPTSSDDLITSSRAAQGGLVMVWDEPYWLVPWLYGFGGSLTAGADGPPSLNTPAMLAALNLFGELAVAAPAEVKTYRGGQRWFGEGEVGLMVDGEWALSEYRSLTETLDLGIAPLPRIPATNQAALPLISGSFLMFARDLSRDDLKPAEELAHYLEQPTTQIELALALGRLPASMEALADPRLQADPGRAAAANQARQAPGLPPTKAARCALFGIDVWLPSLLKGNLDQAETAEAMQAEAEACVTQ